MIEGVIRRDDYDDNRRRRRRRRRFLDDEEVGSVFGNVCDTRDEGGHREEENDCLLLDEEDERDARNEQKVADFVEPKVNPYAYDYLNIKNIDDI